MDSDLILREQLAELLKGGFASNVPLFREFDHEKAGIILNGLHFSAWILLGHIRARQKVLFDFMKNSEENSEVWPEAYWPENYKPKNREEWEKEIDAFEQELQAMINLVQDRDFPLFEKQKNGKTFSWAAMTSLHHTGYHVGQLKTIGRQLGVW